MNAEPVLLSRTRRRLAAVVVAATIMLPFVAVLAQSHPAAAVVHPVDVGVNSDLTWSVSRSTMDSEITSMVQAGVRWARANVGWNQAEPNVQGTLNTTWLSDVDYAVTQMESHGINVLMPIADGVPYWASADPGKYIDSSGVQHWNRYWRPTNYADYANFYGRMVTRYAPMGVHAYEVWNEPNNPSFWPSGVSATDYTGMLKAAYSAIKAADPTATVVLGGLSKNDFNYMQALYSAGARTYFDVAAVHPYSGSYDPSFCWQQSGTTMNAIDAFCGLASVHTVMANNGDGTKGLWLTEFGWSSCNCQYGVTAQQQATYLTSALNLLDSTYTYVTKAFWFSFRNTYWLNDDPSNLEADYGAVTTTLATKPAYTALQSWQGGPTPAPTSSTTSTAPPTTTSTTPASNATAPAISGISASGVTSSGATISWRTNVPTSGQVTYWRAGSTTKYTVSISALVTAHSVSLSGLQSRSTYYFQVSGSTSSGASATSATSSFKTTR